jgi:hypothetical protein
MELGELPRDTSQVVMDGKCQVNMWGTEALCAGTDTEDYFDKYELDQGLAKEIDRRCMSCPVIKECFDYGVQTESFGVWGGVFLNDGKLDNVRNSHKTQDVWARILGLVSEGEDIEI